MGTVIFLTILQKNQLQHRMPGSSDIIAKTHELAIGYKSGNGSAKIVANQIDTVLQAGELICLMGPNGSGKSTLIKTMVGMQPPLGGDIVLFGTPLNQLSTKDIAQKISTVLTDRITIGNLDVFTLVSFGRSPYTSWLGRLRDEDAKKVKWAIEVSGLQPLADRDISTLSDGELQKVMIARALAQDTDLILLDEPTVHLDLPSRVEIMRLLHRLARETNKGILLSTHELDLALKACDKAWLINNNRRLISGVPEDLVLNGTFESVFQRDNVDFDRSTGSFHLHRNNKNKINVQGDTIGSFWTKRALEREGVQVINSEQAVRTIIVEKNGANFRWLTKFNSTKKQKYESIEGLIQSIRNEPM
jgi:iron complex transport system ATP-binding protein